MSQVVMSDAYMNGGEARPHLPEKRHVVVIEPTSTNPSRTNPVQGGSKIQFLNLPTGASAVGSYISVKESYIKMTVRARTATGKDATLNKLGALGLFDHVKVLSSAYIVEDSQHHSRLASLLRDVDENDRNRAGVKETLEGTSGDEEGALLKETAGDLSVEKTMCIPLVGQWWNSHQMTPVHAITDLAYELTLNSDLNCVNQSGNASTQGEPVGIDIVDFKLHLCYVEVSPESKNMLTQKTGLSWSAPTWETIRDNLSAVAQETLKIPSAKSSTKSLIVEFQNADANNAKGEKQDFHARVNPAVASYQFNVNGELYPRQEIVGNEESLMQGMRTFHNDHGYNNKLTPFGTGAADGKTVANDKYFIAMSLESHNKSNSSYSGRSTLAQNPMVTIKSSAAAFTASNVFYHVQYDQKYSIENGIVRISY